MATDPNGINSGRIQPSLIPVMKEGLDITRCILGRAPGVYVAAPTSMFVAGMVLTRNADGYLIPCTGVNPAGLAKWNKTNQMYGTIQGEAIVLVSTTPSPLKHPLVSAVLVTNPMTGLPYTVVVDYTVNATNGTITRVPAGAIADGSTVLVAYRFAAQSSDLDFNGRNFFNFVDDASQAQNRMTLVQGLSTIFTAAYDTSVIYAVNDVMRCGADSYPTNSGAGAIIGMVIQVPTADDPYLGFDLTLTA